MKRTNIYLTTPSIAKLTLLAEKEGVSVSELIRRAIAEFLAKLDIPT